MKFLMINQTACMPISNLTYIPVATKHKPDRILSTSITRLPSGNHRQSAAS